MDAIRLSDVSSWPAHFDCLFDRVGAVFSRVDLRYQARGYVRGLLASVDRKNSWQLAEHLGHDKPFGLQRLLSRASWDADKLRDELVRYACDHLGASDPDAGAVLIVDETGFLKKGTKSVGVQRQYSGTAGRIENCQIGVFLALSTHKGHALIDRALYLPESWCDDRARCDEAGVPEDATFKTKPQLAMEMIARTFDEGIAPNFVLADEVYGNDGQFRRFLEARGQAFVVAVASNQRLWVGLEQRRVDQIAADAPAESWFRLGVAEGSKGPRVYDWNAARFGAPTEHGQQRWLLVRRHVETGELAYYLCCAKPEATPKDLARAAGRRWGIEVCFECAKQQAGLDEYEVRNWDGWHRHVTLSLLAASLLTAVRIAASQATSRRSGRRSKSRGR
jgi:SRSO17 transposase